MEPDEVIPLVKNHTTYQELLDLSYPHNCPWSINLVPIGERNEDGEQSYQVTLVQGEKSISLNSYIPTEKNGHILLIEGDDMEEKGGQSWLHKNAKTSIKIISNPIFLIILLHEIGHTRELISIRDAILRGLKGEKAEDIYRSERFAWGEALKIIRELKRKGINITLGFSRENIHKLIALGLGSYEFLYDPVGLDAPIPKGTKKKIDAILGE